MKLFKALFFLPFVFFNLFSMNPEIDKVLTTFVDQHKESGVTPEEKLSKMIEVSWENLAAEMQIKVICKGVKTAVRPRQAVINLKNQAATDKQIEELVKQNCITLIQCISQKFHIEEFSIAFALDQLAEKWFQKTPWFLQNKDRYNQLNGYKRIEESIESLKTDKLDLMVHHGDEIVAYLAHKFHVSSFKIAFELGKLAEQWFRCNGLLKKNEKLTAQKLSQLKQCWQKINKSANSANKINKNPFFDINFQQIARLNTTSRVADDCASLNTLLIFAADRGLTALVKTLLVNRADPNVANDYGDTAINRAVYKGYKEIVKLLLIYGAHCNVENVEGNTTLNLVGNTEIAQMLKNASTVGEFPIYFSKVEKSDWPEEGSSGTKVSTDPYVFSQLPPFVLSQLMNSGIENPTEQDAQTFLQIWQSNGKELIESVCNGRFVHMQQLLANGADPNFKDQDEQSVLLHACANGKEEAAKILLQHDVDPNVIDKIGCTPLMWASVKEMDSLVPLLIQKGARLNDKDPMGTNALMKACMSGNKKVIKKLLKHNKTDMNAIDEQGQTALMHAVQNESITALEWLVQYGANTTIQDKSGKTAIDYTQNPKILALLTDKKGKSKVQVTPVSPQKKEKTKKEKIVAGLLAMPFATDEDKMMIFSKITEFKLELLLAVNDLLNGNGSEKGKQIKDMVQQEINTQLGA